MRNYSLKLLLLILPIILAALITYSWLQTQEGFHDEKGRYGLRYTEDDSVWKTIDYAAFRSLNSTMHSSTTMQLLWSLTNHRACDAVAALWMISLFLCYIWRNPRRGNRVAILSFGLYIVIMTLVAYKISPAGVDFRRYSPTLVPNLQAEAILMRDLPFVVWKTKQSSEVSFPGDHGTVLLMVGAGLLYCLRSTRYRAAVLFGMFFFALPRLAGGAHWLTDILVGSMIYFVVLFPLFMFEPVRERMLTLLRVPARYILRFAARLTKTPGTQAPAASARPCAPGTTELSGNADIT